MTTRKPSLPWIQHRPQAEETSEAVEVESFKRPAGVASEVIEDGDIDDGVLHEGDLGLDVDMRGELGLKRNQQEPHQDRGGVHESYFRSTDGFQVQPGGPVTPATPDLVRDLDPGLHEDWLKGPVGQTLCLLCLFLSLVLLIRGVIFLSERSRVRLLNWVPRHLNESGGGLNEP